MLISMGTTELTITAAPPSKAKIKEVKSMYKTFKDDMSCLFSRTKKCTPEQKKRIRIEALALISILIVLGFSATIGMPRLIKHKKAGLVTLFDGPSKGYSEEQKQMLLKKIKTLSKEQVNTQKPTLGVKGGITPLWHVAHSGDIEVATALLKKGANPNIDVGGATMMPLHIAAKAHNKEMVELLLRHNANPTLKQGNFNALDWAKWGENPNKDIIEILNKKIAELPQEQDQ